MEEDPKALLCVVSFLVGMLGRSLKHSKNERKEGETKKEGGGIGFVEFSFERRSLNVESKRRKQSKRSIKNESLQL